MLNNYPKDIKKKKKLEEDINEVKKTIYEKSRNINKKVENLKVTKMKIIAEGFKSGFEQSAERFNTIKNNNNN